MAVEITRLAEQEGRPAVVTLGKWEVKPGAVNVIPDEVSFSLDVRHPEEETNCLLTPTANYSSRGRVAARHGKPYLS